MARLLALALVTALLTACASVPRELCGTWASAESRERWWIEGRRLRGEGSRIDAGVEVVTEALLVRPGPRASVYVAAPIGQPATEFHAIPAAEARFGPRGQPGAVHHVWANYAHDFPQEIHYLVSADRLDAAIAGPGRQTGWTFTRTAACPTEPR